MVVPRDPGKPTVSVTLTTYDRKEMLGRALRSVLGQTIPPLEVIVCDDGSTDCTMEELAPEFPAVTWLRQENKGVAAARNLGVRHARGEWIALLDSDDEWKPEKLERQLSLVKKNPRLKACHTGEAWVRNGNPVTLPKFLDKSPTGLFSRSLRRCLICPSSVLLHHEVFSEIGYFDESFPVCEDYDFWLRLLLLTRPGLVDQALVGVRSFVADEGVGLFGGGGQADQVEVQTPDQAVSVRVLGRLEIMLLEVFENEGIDSVALPLRVLRRRSGGNGMNEGPVLVVLRALLDPFLEQVLFLGREGGMRLGRGHDLLRVVRADAVMKFALLDLARNDDLVLQGILPDVQAEFCLSSFLVGPVASIALACKKRTDFTVEINRLRMNREE